jgi:hypothetical protein
MCQEVSEEAGYSPKMLVRLSLGLTIHLVNISRSLMLQYMPWLPTIPLHQGMTWDPTWKAALPTHRITQRILKSSVCPMKKGIDRVRSCLTSLAYEVAGFQFLMVGVHAAGEQWSQGCGRLGFDTRWIATRSCLLGLTLTGSRPG